MHLKVITILEGEANSIEKGLIHIHRENDKWYAYEQSAFLLNGMVDEHLVISRYIVDEWIWLVRAEVNPEQIPHEYVICHSRDEFILHYLPTMNFYEWILTLG